MHRLPSQSSVTRFRLAAYLYVLFFLLLIPGASYLGWALFNHHHQHVIFASCAMGAAVATFVFHWITASRVRCPLCLVPSLAKKNCSKNRNAKRLLGSYRLKVSSSIILHNNFRCPYCNEPTVLEVRQRKSA
jgi:hypothetical protein